MPGELSNENAQESTPTPKPVATTDMKTTTSVASNGEGGGVCKLTFNLIEEFQGDSSLEPGEVITPPHGSIKSKDAATDIMVSTKKVLKDALSKAVKKTTQINTAIIVDEQAESEGVNSGELVEKNKLVNGNDEGATAREDDDSEGLYSGSDSSGDEQKIDKNAVRYELHPKTSTQTLHAPPVDNFAPVIMTGPFNFMPRMQHFMPRGSLQARGNMRPGFFRPPPFHGHLRPYGNAMGMPRQHMLRPHTPPPSRGHSPIRAPKPNATSTCSGGTSTISHSLPPLNAATRTTRTGESTSNRPAREHLLWTSVGKTSVNWSLGTQIRNRIDDMCHEYSDHSKNNSKRREMTTKPEEKSIGTTKQEEKSRNHRHRSQSVERSTKKTKSETFSEENVICKRGDKPEESNGEDKKPKEGKKVFDIFAESPPRLSAPTATETKRISLEKIRQEKLSPKEKPKRKEDTKLENRMRDKRSRTPPLSGLIDEKSKAPLMDAMAIQTRIDKLLQDSDLQLETLLANKEKFLQKTRELKKNSHSEKQNKSKKEQADTIKGTKSHHRSDTNYTPERHKARAEELVRIKTEPLDTIDDAYNFSRVDLNRPIKRESSPWEEEETIKVKRFTHSPLQAEIKSEDSPWEDEEPIIAKVSLTPFDNGTAKHKNPFKQTVLREQEDQRRLDSIERNSKGYHQHRRVETVNLTSPYVKLANATDLVQSNHLDTTCDSLSKSTNSSKTTHSPDTDDYIDNWENDDSTAACDGTTSKVFTSISEDASSSNHFWNATNTPGVANKSTTPTATPPQKVVKQIIDMQDMYDKFLKSIKMNPAELNPSAVETAMGKKTESPTSTESTDSSNSSTHDTGAEVVKSSLPTHKKVEASMERIKPMDELRKPESEQHLKSNVSKDLKRLKTLEGNLARIQMMRENYDSGDELCEELVKMESLFLAEKSAIMEKYKKTDIKLGGSSKKLDAPETDDSTQMTFDSPKLEIVPNKIFDANREAIKLTLSPFKLARKAAIFEKDDGETTSLATTQNERETAEKLLKPAKEIAIVKPIMDTKPKRAASPSRRSRRRSTSRNRRSNSRSHSHGKGHSQSPRRRRPFSPARNRVRFRNAGSAGGIGSARRSRSRSFSPKRSFSRSRSRSRSPNRRRRLRFARKRNSYSPPPPPLVNVGPRSPPMPRRRSYSREQYSRSPLPFKPPSPPMRRSCSSSPSHSPRRTRISRSRSRSRTRSRSPYPPYYSHNSQDNAPYYYDMPQNQMALDTHINIVLNNTQNAPNPDGSYGGDYANYGSYMESTYVNDETGGYYSDPYHSQFYSNMPAAMQAVDGMPSDMYYNGFGETHGLECTGADTTVLKELPKAPLPPVAVQKGNVLEIVPTSELSSATPTSATATAPASVPALKSTLADKAAKLEAKQQRKEAQRLKKLERKKAIELASKSSKKKVNFEDRVDTNLASDDEDQNVIERAVQRAIKKYNAHSQKPEAKKSRCLAKALLAGPLPLPPSVTPGTQLVQPKYLIKKPVIRYYHFDSNMGIMYFSYNRIHKPLRFDPKCMPMFFNSGKYAGPPPPNSIALALKSNGPMAKEILIPSHPPPPLGHPIAGIKGPQHVLMPPGFPTQIPPTPSTPMRFYNMRINNYMRLRQPHFVRAPEAQPIPVLGLSYNMAPTANPAQRMLMTAPPLHPQSQQPHLHLHPQQPEYGVMSVPPPARAPAYLTAQQPAPQYIQPEYSTMPLDAMLNHTTMATVPPPIHHFNVTPIPSITEIKPVEVTPAGKGLLPPPAVVMQQNDIVLKSATVTAARDLSEPTVAHTASPTTPALSLVKT